MSTKKIGHIGQYVHRISVVMGMSVLLGSGYSSASVADEVEPFAWKYNPPDFRDSYDRAQAERRARTGTYADHDRIKECVDNPRCRPELEGERRIYEDWLFESHDPHQRF